MVKGRRSARGTALAKRTDGLHLRGERVDQALECRVFARAGLAADRDCEKHVERRRKGGPESLGEERSRSIRTLTHLAIHPSIHRLSLSLSLTLLASATSPPMASATLVCALTLSAISCSKAATKGAEDEDEGGGREEKGGGEEAGGGGGGGGGGWMDG